MVNKVSKNITYLNIKELIEKGVREISVVTEEYPSHMFYVEDDKKNTLLEIDLTSEQGEKQSLEIEWDIWDQVTSYGIEVFEEKTEEEVIPPFESGVYETDDSQEGIYVKTKSGKVYYIQVGREWRTNITGYQAYGITYYLDPDRIKWEECTEWF